MWLHFLLASIDYRPPIIYSYPISDKKIDDLIDALIT